MTLETSTVLSVAVTNSETAHGRVPHCRTTSFQNGVQSSTVGMPLSLLYVLHAQDLLSSLFYPLNRVNPLSRYLGPFSPQTCSIVSHLFFFLICCTKKSRFDHVITAFFLILELKLSHPLQHQLEQAMAQNLGGIERVDHNVAEILQFLRCQDRNLIEPTTLPTTLSGKAASTKPAQDCLSSEVFRPLNQTTSSSKGCQQSLVQVYIL